MLLGTWPKTQKRALIALLIKLSAFAYSFRLVLLLIAGQTQQAIKDWQWELVLIAGVVLMNALGIYLSIWLRRRLPKDG